MDKVAMSYQCVWSKNENVILIFCGNGQNSEKMGPRVSSEVAQPEPWLRGCGLMLPGHMECYLSFGPTSQTRSKEREKRTGNRTRH